MPRIRSIKPEYFSHPVLGDCAPLTRLAFIGLWCFADRRGRVKDDPRRLKVLILPFDELDFDAALSELERQGLIHRYQVDGQRLLQVVNFEKHQRCHIHEPESTLPAPHQHGASTVRAPHSAPRKGKERKGSRSVPSDPPSEDLQVLHPTGVGPSAEGIPVEEAMMGYRMLLALWNAHAPPLPRALEWNAKRRQAAKVRWAEHPKPEYWQEVIAKIPGQLFLMGENDRGWRATFDWLLRPGSATGVLEGHYAHSGLRRVETFATAVERQTDEFMTRQLAKLKDSA